MLLVPGIGIAWIGTTISAMRPLEVVAGAGVVALCANLAFLLGPMAELYVSAFLLGGRPVGRGRLLIFGAGIVVSAGVFLLAGLAVAELGMAGV